MESLGVVPGTHVGLVFAFLATIPIVLIRWSYIEETIKQSPSEATGGRPVILPALTQIRALPSEVWKLIVVATLSSFGFQIFWSFLVVYCVEELGLSMIQWSLLSVVGNLAAACFMVPSGFLSDKVGRRRIIILSQLSVSLASLGYFLSPGFVGVAVSRFIGGVGEGLGGNVMGSVGGPVWQALVTDVAPLEVRGGVLGLMGTVSGFLSMPAPVFGGFLYENVSPQIVFLASFILGVLGCLIFSLWVREPVECPTQTGEA